MDDHNAREQAWLNGYRAGRESVEKSGPIDVAIVRHGRWDDGRCTNCNTVFTVTVNGNEELVAMNSDYCPACGAKMDGGADNDKGRSD